jgi:hypothetical protein
VEFESPHPGCASPPASSQRGSGAPGRTSPIGDPVGTSLERSHIRPHAGRALNMPQRSPTVTPPSGDPGAAPSAEDASLHGSYAQPREG